MNYDLNFYFKCFCFNSIINQHRKKKKKNYFFLINHKYLQTNQLTNQLTSFHPYILHLTSYLLYIIYQMIQNFLITIIPNRLLFMADCNPPKDVHNAFFFNIDQDLTYQPFYQDFGPLNIAKVWKYVHQVSKILNDKQYENNIFYHHCSPHYKKCTNAAFLICAFQIVVMKKTAEQSFKPFQKVTFKPFRDASYGQCSYKCTIKIIDCLKGLEYAIKLDWFNFKRFDLAQYEHYQQLQNGDLNWIVPGKLIAFSSPYDAPKDKHGNKLMSPKQFVPIFKKLSVKGVIRLNSLTYDPSQFIKNGIQHHQLYFTDGTSPTKQIVYQFLQKVQKIEGVVAVHCKAGLGRTGCLIGCYIMKHYKFYAAQLIGWMRLCRPGSVLGPQQYFMHQFQEILHQQSQNSPIWKKIKSKLTEQQLQIQMKKITIKDTKMNEHETQVSKHGETGQGNRLLQAKKKKKIVQSMKEHSIKKI